MTEPVPNPGSDEAAELGCLCPRMDNRYGRGYWDEPQPDGTRKPQFVVSLDCPLHGGGS